MERKQRLILLINDRFLPDTSADGYGFGVVKFALSIAEELAVRDQFAGFIAYRRDETLDKPIITSRRLMGFPAVEFHFNYQMKEEPLREAFAFAIDTLQRPGARGDTSMPPPIVYHQTNTLLFLNPRRLPFIVTHHGPFAHEVRRLFGDRFACEAFQGGRQKLRHLISTQARGLQVLRVSKLGVAIELSGVQEAVLLRSQIPARRIFRAPPPLPDPLRRVQAAEAMDRENADGCEVPGDFLHIISAAARVDAFKNLYCLIESANLLAATGAKLRLSLFVGGRNEQEQRRALYGQVQGHLRSRTTIAARLPHKQLMHMLHAERSRGVFVCTSLYETFGMTPLEATLSGMTTLVPDTPARIGVAEFISLQYRFPCSAQGLLEKLSYLAGRRDLRDLGEQERALVLQKTGPDAFLEVVGAAVSSIVRNKDRRKVLRAELNSATSGLSR